MENKLNRISSSKSIEGNPEKMKKKIINLKSERFLKNIENSKGNSYITEREKLPETNRKLSQERNKNILKQIS